MIPLGTSVRSSRLSMAVWVIIVANVWVFLWQVGLGPTAREQVVIALGVVPRREVLALAEVPADWRAWLLPMLTSQFLHGGLAHIASNMIFLWVFGPPLENRMGARRFFVFYVLCGIAASQAQVVAHLSSTTPMIGASGAIAGVLGAYLLLYPRSRVILMVPIFIIPYFFELPAVLFLGVWFLMQLSFGLLGQTQEGGVAWWAHVGGFVAGLGLLFVFLDRAHLGHAPLHYRDPRVRHLPY